MQLELWASSVNILHGIIVLWWGHSFYHFVLAVASTSTCVGEGRAESIFHKPFTNKSKEGTQTTARKTSTDLGKVFKSIREAILEVGAIRIGQEFHRYFSHPKRGT